MTEAETGSMITIYAWVVALLSLPLMLLTCHMELKKLILLTVGVFGIGQLLSGLGRGSGRSRREVVTSRISATLARQSPPPPCSYAGSAISPSSAVKEPKPLNPSQNQYSIKPPACKRREAFAFLGSAD